MNIQNSTLEEKLVSNIGSAPDNSDIDKKEQECLDYSLDRSPDKETNLNQPDDTFFGHMYNSDRKSESNDQNEKTEEDNTKQTLTCKHDSEEELPLLNANPYSDDLFEDFENEIPSTEAKTRNKSPLLDDHDLKRLFLRKDLCQALTNISGVERMSDLQASGLPPALKGRNCILQGPPRSGKTLLTLITILQSLPQKSKNERLHALIICHSRESVTMIEEMLTDLSSRLIRQKAIRIASFHGGISNLEESKQMCHTPDILIGIPGRLTQFASKPAKRLLKNLKHLIIDNFDFLMRNKFLKADVDKLVLASSGKKQTILTATTLPNFEIIGLKEFAKDPFEIYTEKEKLLPHTLHQYAVQYKDAEISKTNLVVDILENFKFQQAIIFVNSKKDCDNVETFLQEQLFPCIVLHSDMSYLEIQDALKSFKDNLKRILVTTDLLSRVTVSQQVNLVINYDVPSDLDVLFLQTTKAVPDYFSTKKGVAIHIVGNDTDEQKLLEKYQAEFSCLCEKLPSDPELFQLPEDFKYDPTERKIENEKRKKEAIEMKKKAEEMKKDAEEMKKEADETKKEAEKIKKEAEELKIEMLTLNSRGRNGKGNHSKQIVVNGKVRAVAVGRRTLPKKPTQSSLSSPPSGQGHDNVRSSSPSSSPRDSKRRHINGRGEEMSLEATTIVEASVETQKETKHTSHDTDNKRPDIFSRRSKSSLLSSESTSADLETKLKLMSVGKVILQRNLKVIKEPPPSHACVIL